MDTTPTDIGIMVSSSTPAREREALGQGQELLGRYRILHRLGSGGYGDVVAAMDPERGRQVAIKVLNPRALRSDPSALARMRQEAELLRSIQHPNVVEVLDFHSEGDDHLLVMELLEGTPLDLILGRHGPPPSERILPLVRQLLEALRAAHEVSVLHRDIKPENIVLLGEGEAQQVKLVDFGLAKQVGGRMSASGEDDPTLARTRAGGFLGTPRYCSPEQAVGDPLGPSSDLFSLGLVVAEWLTGTLRLQGETYGDLMTVLVSQHPIDLHDVPFVWRGWLRRMLAKRVAERYPNAAAALEGLREGVELPLRGGHTARETSRELEFDVDTGRFVPAPHHGAHGVATQESADLLALGAPLDLHSTRRDPTAGPSTPAHGVLPPMSTSLVRPRFERSDFLALPPVDQTTACADEPPTRSPSDRDHDEPQLTPALFLGAMIGSGLLVFALLLLVNALLG